jgi:prepilin-type processing-associated H-X9-DG protein
MCAQIDDDSDFMRATGNTSMIRMVKVAFEMGVALLALAFFCMLVLALLPPLGRSTPRTRKIQSQINLRQIYLEINLYTNENRGQYPDTFATLFVATYLNQMVFVSPFSQDTPADGPTTQAIAQNILVPGHSSYVYLGRGMTAAAVGAKTVIAYERPDIFGDGGNVLYGDGQVRFENADTLKRIIAATAQGRMGGRKGDIHQ